MAVGDIIFYDKTKSGNLINWAISAWTHSRFSHTAIDIGGGKQAESGADGVIERKLDLKDATVWSYAKNAKDIDPKDMAGAVAWVKEMVRQHANYGYVDFFTAANPLVKIVYLTHPGTYDCSAFCTAFLAKAGGVDLCGLDLDVHLVTPASLSKCLGVK